MKNLNVVKRGLPSKQKLVVEFDSTKIKFVVLSK